MKYRNIVANRQYDTISEVRRNYCLCMPSCDICPLYQESEGTIGNCVSWVGRHPEKAAKLMGYTIVEDEKPTQQAQEEPQRHFDTGAVRDNATGKGRYDLLPWGAIHALAQHCERGALHYGERNVDKGIPQKSFIDSGIRHLSMYIQGDAEDHHLVAAMWNIAWALEQEIKRPEMIDLPERTEKSGKAV